MIEGRTQSETQEKEERKTCMSYFFLQSIIQIVQQPLYVNTLTENVKHLPHVIYFI